MARARAQGKTLGPGPGDHRGIVGGELWWWKQQFDSLSQSIGKPLAQRCVGGHTTSEQNGIERLLTTGAADLLGDDINLNGAKNLVFDLVLNLLRSANEAAAAKGGFLPPGKSIKKIKQNHCTNVQIA